MYEDKDFIPNTAFLIISFDESMNNIRKIIKEAFVTKGIDISTADDDKGSHIITNHILKSIEEAEFIVADLTQAKQNVYYELGLAHGVGNDGNDILLLAKEGEKIHFDVKHMHINFYKSEYDLQEFFKENLANFIAKSRI